MNDELLEQEIDLEDAHTDLFNVHARGTRIQIMYATWCALLCSYIAYLSESLFSTGAWSFCATIYGGIALYLIPTYRKAKKAAREAAKRKQRLEDNLAAIEAFGARLRAYGRQRWLDS